MLYLEDNMSCYSQRITCHAIPFLQVTTTLEEAQARLSKLIAPTTIIIGHSLDTDFKVRDGNGDSDDHDDHEEEEDDG